MYARTVENPDTGQAQTLTFGVSGRLIMNVLVMYDRETDSYWSQLLGKAIEGPLTDAELTPLAATQTTWALWKEQYPETKALTTNGMGGYDSYASYYRSGDAGVLGESRADRRLTGKELVLGVVLDGQPAAYPRGVLRAEGVVNDTVGDAAVTIWFEPDTATARMFSRTIVTEAGDEQVLTFESTVDNVEFRDVETGSTWLLLNGTAIDGPLKGAVLTAVPSTSSFWFGWKDWYPETYLYKGLYER